MPSRIGPLEQAVRADLRKVAAEDRKGGLAKLALSLAARMDEGTAGLRDTASMARELRATLVELMARTRPIPKVDPVDDLAKRRAERRRTG